MYSQTFGVFDRKGDTTLGVHILEGTGGKSKKICIVGSRLAAFATK